MATRAQVLENARKQRQQREAQRKSDEEEVARTRQFESAAQKIQKVVRGSIARSRWLENDWKTLEKQVQDLENVSVFVRQKGQQFVAPCKVLMQLLLRASRHGKRPSNERVDVFVKLAALLVSGLRAPANDKQRGICSHLDGVSIEHNKCHAVAPDPSRIVVKFAEVFFDAVVTSSTAAGAVEFAALLEVNSWGQGRGLQDVDGCKKLASNLLTSATNPTCARRTGSTDAQRLASWRTAATSAISFWPGGQSTVPDRIKSLVGIAASWLRLIASCEPLRIDVGNGIGDLLEVGASVPRIGSLLGAQISITTVPTTTWATLLRALGKNLRYLDDRANGSKSKTADIGRADREHALIYLSGNLWELYGLGIGVPLDLLLEVQASLSNSLEVSMIPGFGVAANDEAIIAQTLREQFRHFADHTSATNIFSSVLHLQTQLGDPAMFGKATTPYERHCVAVAFQLVKVSAVSACCRIYNHIFAKVHLAMKASRVTTHTQAYYSLANAIAFMDGGDVAKVLWRMALCFYDLEMLLYQVPAECYHILFLVVLLLSQLFNVMSHDDIRSPKCPLNKNDLQTFVSVATRFAAHLIRGNGSEIAGGNISGMSVEVFLVQVGRVLSQLKGFASRLGDVNSGQWLPADTWHAPDEIVEDFKRAVEFGPDANTQTGQHGFAERLLRHLPHCIPFDHRVSLLRACIQAKRAEFEYLHATKLVIRRTHIFEDGLQALWKSNWYSRFQVVFVNAAGTQELGQDIGGLFKEFWEKLSETAFNPNYGLFKMTESRLLYPNPDADQYHGNTTRLFEFLGLVIGKAIYEGIVVEPCFAQFFLAKLLGRHNSYYDLQTLDPQLFANLQQLKEYDGDVVDFCCSFVAPKSDGGEVPLLPKGEDTPVTNDNRFKYIYLLSDYKLNVELKTASTAFLSGFQRLIDERWLRMFGESELQQIISGSLDNILDVEDLRQHTRYMNCSPRDKVVVNFFKALGAMEQSDRLAVLRFTTSCSRTPLLGFQHLEPPFTLVKVDVRKDAEKLPTASTCFNALKLPTYSNWKVTKQKLEYVIAHGVGFELD